MAAASNEIEVSRHSYDIFLSFRGKDTRTHFTDHLYSALKQAGFHTFRDDDELVRGENIESELHKAIRESRISLVVFSKDYASSPWCLDELLMIMNKRRDGSHAVLPIFYGVPPSHVRTQTGSFSSSFSKYTKHFSEQTDKINQWRTALKDAADLSGMELKDGMYETEFNQEVVREVRNKLRPRKLDLTPHLVGIDSRVTEIEGWLHDKANEISMGQIYGIGGIGKTTTAKFLYNKNSQRFECSSFVSKVKDASKDQNGLIRVQNQLLSDILKGKKHDVYDTEDGIIKIRNAISLKKVLIILDDVDDSNQLEALLGKQRLQLCMGSKIILTSRHGRLHWANQNFRKFKIKGLDEKESLELFSWCAFCQNHPINSYLEFSKEAALRCGGLPLALTVVGSSLFRRDIDVWKCTLEKLKVIPHSEVQRILRISYDSLEDDRDRALFLDVACFFVGMEKNYVTAILDGCGFHTATGILNLVDRCLLSVQDDNTLSMHQLLIEMGREVVRQESPDDPGKRSRLWKYSDAFTVLQDGSGTNNIKGIVFDQHMLVECANYICIELLRNSSTSLHTESFKKGYFHTKSFKKIRKLQIIHLRGVNVNGNFKDFPKNLVLLCWNEFSFRCIPSNFHLEKLVSLDLSYSAIESVSDGTMNFPMLRFLNLSHCKELTKMPNFTKSPCVERLIFRGCVKILEVDDSIEHLKGLKILNLKDCLKLERLSKNFNMLESLEEIDLSGCVYLDELPREMGKFKSLKVFYAYQTAVLHKFRTEETPRSTNFSLACLPSSLVDLNLGKCNLSENAFPSDLSMFGSLKKLDISESRFSRLPESIASLPMLNSLILNYCTGIQLLEKLPVNLEWLSTVGCSSLERIESPQLSRVSLFVDFCEKLDEIEGVYKMYPINRIDKAIAKSLSVSNLESLANIEVDMLNDFTYTKKTSSLQVLEEDGVLNIFSAVDDDNPNCFDVLKHPFGKYISFDVLPNDGHKKIYGMNICISYKVSHNVLSQYLLDACRRRHRYIRGYFDYEFELKLGLPDLPEKALLLGITNKTKKLEWVYGPTCYAVPRDEEKIQWVSHWRFGDQFEVGDKVSIHVSTNYGFEINDMKCGVKLVYEDEENYEVDWEQTPLDSCWSQREGTPGGVKRFPMNESWEREIEDSDSTKTYEDEDICVEYVDVDHHNSAMMMEEGNQSRRSFKGFVQKLKSMMLLK